MAVVYLSLGSNMGDREGNLQKALMELEVIGTVRKVSGFHVTKPFGKTDQPDFLNAAVEFETELLPEELMLRLNGIEQKLGRVRKVRWGPRTIDIDIIFYGFSVYNRDGIVIPHPEVQNRDFVLKPLADICPEFVHPVFYKTIRQMQRELNAKRQDG